MTATDLIRMLVPRSVRNALRRPRISILRTIAKVRFGFGEADSVLIRPDWMLRCHPICTSEFEVFRADPEQTEELETFVQHCTPDMHLLDVGAHWGLFGLAAVRYGGSKVKVTAVEASPAAAKILKHNFVLNSSSSQVTLVNCAAGECAGEINMLTTGAGGADYYVIPSSPRPDTTTVRQVALDEICRVSGFVPSHLKIDVEGYEEEVIRGAERTIRSARPIVFLELHGSIILKRQRKPESVVTLLQDFGYRSFFARRSPITVEALAARQFNMRFVAVSANS